ncbi:MAG: DUF3106 domain-containing protein [Luteimonas sp.]|nr:DUF3106 domain-containing protein [Luteimonas sp.]
MKTFPALLAVLLLAPVTGFAQQSAQALPEWEQLTQQQREQLIAPVRERWNSSTQDKRHHMLDHAARWQSMTPAERERARHGERRWRDMPPERREQARALFEHMRTLPEAERKAMVERWKAMTPEQRKAWMDANPPREPRRER